MPLPCSPSTGLTTMAPCSRRKAALASASAASACCGTFRPAWASRRAVTRLSAQRLMATALVSSLSDSRQTTLRPPWLSLK